MQPGPPPEYQQPGLPVQQPAAGWPPAPGHWGPQSPPAAATSPAVEPARAGRPGLVTLVAVLVEIIVIAAAGNQWVGDRVNDAADQPGTLGYDAASALLTFYWRFGVASNDPFHTVYGQWALLGVLLVVSTFLIALAARGPARFARVFFGTWAAVVVATGLGAIARGAIVDGRLLQGKSRFQYALFSGIGPSQYVFVAGLALGFVVGLAAGFTALAARRDDEAPARREGFAPVVTPAPVEQRSGGADEAPTTQFEQRPSGTDAAPTTQFEQRPSGTDAAPTTQFERTGPADPDATQAFRPARDEPDPIEQFRPQREPEPTQEMRRVEDDR